MTTFFTQRFSASFSGGSLDGKIACVPRSTRYTHATGERYVRTGVYMYIDEESGEHKFERFHYKLADFLDEWDENEPAITDIDMTGRGDAVARLAAERADLESRAVAATRRESLRCHGGSFWSSCYCGWRSDVAKEFEVVLVQFDQHTCRSGFVNGVGVRYVPGTGHNWAGLNEDDV
jgi:hypothetical protein